MWTREIFLRGAAATATLCEFVQVCVCVCVCLRAGSPFWPNAVRQTAVAVGEQGERKGVAVAVATLTISRRNARTIRLHA